MTQTWLRRVLKRFAVIILASGFVSAIVIWEFTSVSGSLVQRGAAPVTEASIQLTNEATQQSRSVVTEERGSFVFRRLLPGTYHIEVSAAGFDDLTIPSIVVHAGRPSPLGLIQLHYPRPKTPKELREKVEGMGSPFTDASWTWTDKHGNTCTFEDLYDVLVEYWSWLESGKPRKDPSESIEIRATHSAASRDHPNPAEPATPAAQKCGKGEEDTGQFDSAKMAGAPLSEATLRGASFARATLTGANFHGTNLTGAEFQDANLESVSFGGANVQGAKFGGEKLSLKGAKFCGADLTRANFTGANLSGASFIPCVSIRSSANLSRADLTGVNLSGDIGWSGANVAGVLFEPKSLPQVDQFKLVQYLELLTYFHNPKPLIELREQFQQAGLEEEQDKISYALNGRKSQLLWEGCSPQAVAFVPWGDSWRTKSQQLVREGRYGQILLNCAAYGSRRILFDLTCSYGMSRSRPLLLAAGLWFVASFALLVLLHYPGRSRLYFVAKRSEGDKLRTREGRIRVKPITGTRWWRRTFSWLRREGHLLWTAMLFAFLSMFNLDVREIPLMGRAIALVRGRNYEFRATRTMRTVSGLQSWVSGYLILLWLFLLGGHFFG